MAKQPKKPPLTTTTKRSATQRISPAATTRTPPAPIPAPATPSPKTPLTAATKRAVTQRIAPSATVRTPPAPIATPPSPAPKPKEKARPADFSEFMSRLARATDPAKLEKATDMLKAERFKLFAKVAADHVVGVVKSQTNPGLVYSCRLGENGSYACCTQNLNICGGLRGSPCKHLLVLVVGLAKAGELAPAAAHDWTQAARGKKAELDKEAMTATFLQYKGAEAGEVDWRPTETIPEDFYAM